MKILITGGAGFIGSKLVDKLLINNHEIIILDNFLEQIHGKKHFFKNNVKYIIGDVKNESDWVKALNENPEIIFHLASETGTGQSMDEINRYVTTNILGTSTMLEVLNKNKNKVKKIILTSTRAVYGDLDNFSDTLITDPKSVYALTKLAQENLIKTSSKVPYTILRYQNVFGEGQSLNNPYTGIISIFSNLFLDNKTVTIYDNGSPTRDFIYVDDVVNATILCMENDETNYQTYDIGTGKETKILDVAHELKKIINSKSEILITNYHREGDIMFAKANTSKIKSSLGWESQIQLQDGLNFFFNWFKAEKNI